MYDHNTILILFYSIVFYWWVEGRRIGGALLVPGMNKGTGRDLYQRSGEREKKGTTGGLLV
jgi:hypothetical protein